MVAPNPTEQAADSAPALSAAILAGGASRRMGVPKAGLALAGRPMIAYAIEAAKAAGLAPIVVAKPGAPLPSLPCPLLEEPAEPRHPLTGVIAALEHLAAPIVVLACDVPLVPPVLLTRLATDAAAFAMPSHPRAQPLIARYSPGLLPRLRDSLARGAAITELAAGLGGTRLGEADLAGLADPDGASPTRTTRRQLARIGAEIERRRQAA